VGKVDKLCLAKELTYSALNYKHTSHCRGSHGNSVVGAGHSDPHQQLASSPPQQEERGS